MKRKPVYNKIVAVKIAFVKRISRELKSNHEVHEEEHPRRALRIETAFRQSRLAFPAGSGCENRGTSYTGREYPLPSFHWQLYYIYFRAQGVPEKKEQL